jgi:hypothetical protein
MNDTSMMDAIYIDESSFALHLFNCFGRLLKGGNAKKKILFKNAKIYC